MSWQLCTMSCKRVLRACDARSRSRLSWRAWKPWFGQFVSLACEPVLSHQWQIQDLAHPEPHPGASWRGPCISPCRPCRPAWAALRRSAPASDRGAARWGTGCQATAALSSVNRDAICSLGIPAPARVLLVLRHLGQVLQSAGLYPGLVAGSIQVRIPIIPAATNRVVCNTQRADSIRPCSDFNRAETG